jgi:nucleotide-binding universal stress UspA family protein
MYKHILIATDGSDLAEIAVAQGLALAKQIGASVTAVHVSEPMKSLLPGEAGMGFPLEDYTQSTASRAEQILAAVVDAAKRIGVSCAQLHVTQQFASTGIIEAAKRKKCDLIVMASHGRKGIAKLLLGSETIKVLTRGTIPVLVCR